MSLILLLFDRIANAPRMLAIIPSMVIAAMTTPAGQSAIDAATRRNGKVFATYIGWLVVAAILTAIFTWWTWYSGNKVQDAVKADADARIAEATQKTAVAQQTAGEANERSKGLEKDNLKLRKDLVIEQGKVAQLQVDAYHAKAAQQKVETDLAKAQTEAANASAAAAEANRKADEERVKRLVIEKGQKPRKLFVKMYEDGTTNLDDLKKFGAIEVLIEYPEGEDIEPCDAAENLRFVLDEAGWKVTISPVRDFTASAGVTVMNWASHDGNNVDREWQGNHARDTLKGWLLSNDWVLAGGGLVEEPHAPYLLLITVGRKPETDFDMPEQFKRITKETEDPLKALVPNANPTKAGRQYSRVRSCASGLLIDNASPQSK